jgi:hypothetical protein
MYDVEVTPSVVSVALGGEVLMRLDGGAALLIGLTYANFQHVDPQRADDFMHGVLSGINHCAMTGQVPAVVLALEGPGGEAPC